MRYIVIPATGELNVTGGDDTAWLADIGPEAPLRVPLNPLDGLRPITGWVNSAGAAAYPLNSVGGQTLINLGAAAGDYHGPVVITAWSDDDGGQARGLVSDQAAVVTAAYEAATQNGE